MEVQRLRRSLNDWSDCRLVLREIQHRLLKLDADSTGGGGSIRGAWAATRHEPTRRASCSHTVAGKWMGESRKLTGGLEVKVGAVLVVNREQKNSQTAFLGCPSSATPKLKFSLKTVTNTHTHTPINQQMAVQWNTAARQPLLLRPFSCSSGFAVPLRWKKNKQKKL